MTRSIKPSRVLSIAIGMIAAFAGSACAAIFSNSASITLPAPGTSSGSSIAVSGVGNSLTAVSVQILNFSATNPSDVGLVLVDPAGAAMALMGDAGGTSAIQNFNVTFSDSGGSLVPAGGGIVSGTFKPTQYAPIGSFPSPGPGNAYVSPAVFGTTTLLSAFGGINPNGTWSLYAIDTASGNSGQIAGGWDLQVQSVPEPASLSIIAVAGACLAARPRRPGCRVDR
jgi:hypothetical protein